jgi:hypothetical protein
MKNVIERFFGDEAGFISLSFVTMVAVVLFISVLMIQFAGLSVLGYVEAMIGVLTGVNLAL